MSKGDLAVHILKEFHGELVFKVGQTLIKKGTSSLGRLVHETGLLKSKVQEALLILIQHGMVGFAQDTHGVLNYKIYVDQVTHRIYFPKLVQCAGHLYGDAAEMIVEELLHEGRLPMNTLIAKVTKRVNEALLAQNTKAIQPSLVQDKFERLVGTHFIKRCSTPVCDDTSKLLVLEEPSPALMFQLPTAQESGAPPAKQMKLDASASQQKESSDVVFWEINFRRFLLHFRDQALVSAVASRLDSEKAAEVLRTILRHCEKTTDPAALTTQPMSFYEIQSQLPKELAMTKQTLEQWLKIMTESMPQFVSRCADSGGGMYEVNIFRALETLCSAHIETVVEESKFVLQIENCVLMPTKQTKELLYKMFQEHFVSVTELSKTPDHAAARTYYLFNVDIKQVARKLLENSYKALKNVIIKRQQELSDAKRLLEKQERVEAIIASLGLPPNFGEGGEEGGGMVGEVDDEKKEQVEAIMETITPPEREQLSTVKALSNYMESSELQLVDSTIFILESFLALTFRPPQPKKVKHLLDT